jgi:hypothetical protein
LGLDHPDVGIVLASYSELLKVTKRKKEAVAMWKRAELIAAKLQAASPASRFTIDFRELQEKRN